MKRRSFLGFLGGAAAAGPSMAKSAADMAMTDLTVSGNGMNGIAGASSGIYSDGPSEWAKDNLKRFLGRTESVIAHEKRGRAVYALEPDIASMRSLSMRAKISISRDRQYDRAERHEHESLLGRIAGWWS